MVTYMIEIGKLIQDTTSILSNIKRKLDKLMQREWSLGSDEDAHKLARATRNTVSTLLMTKQTELKLL